MDERTGRLVSGHGRLEALLQMRETRPADPPAGVRAEEGAWLVPVIRGWASRTDAEAEAFLIAANRTGELGGWEKDALADLLKDLAGGDELLGTGYDSDDLDALIAEEKPKTKPVAATGEDVVPEEPKKIWVALGEVYKLGRHRLVLGDSHREADRLKLFGGKRVDAVITDPPYAIYGSSSGIASDIADDKMVRPFFRATFEAIRSILPKFGHLCLFTDWRSWSAIWESAREVEGISCQNMLVWDKGGAGLGSNYAMTHELIFFGSLRPKQSAMGNRESGVRTVYKPNVFHCNRVTGDEREHNAAKPVGLIEELIQASTDPDGKVGELFTGSGSTLIACEKQGRSCFAMELDPKNAQITIERWQRFTGQKAERENE